MILQQLKALLQRHGTLAMKELSQWLQAEPEAVRGMLEHLQARGLVERLPSGTPCSGCDHCPPEQIELWRWLGEAAPDHAVPPLTPVNEKRGDAP